MTNLPPALVLDCTVTVPWYLTDEASPLSETLFDAQDRCTLVVPVLWRLEFVSAMRAAFRRGRIPADRMAAIFSQAARLPLLQDPLALDVAAIAEGCAAYDLTPYDLVYLAVARERALPLATFDAALLRACRKAGVAVLTDDTRVAEPAAGYRAARRRPSRAARRRASPSTSSSRER